MSRLNGTARGTPWLLGLLVLIWGASWPIVKIGVTAMPPLWFACLRYVAGTICVLVIAAVRRELIVPSRADGTLILVSGVLQMAAYSAFTSLALTRLPPGRASVLAFSTPVWVVPMSVWWLNERVGRAGRIGVGAGLAGVVLIASSGVQPLAREQLTAYALLMCAAAAWAASIVFVRAHRFQASALALAPWQMLVAALLLLACAVAANGPLPPLNAAGVASLAYVGPLATAFAYWAVVEVGRHVRATTISVTLLAVPALGLLISALTFDEAVNVSLALGVTLIGLGVLLTTVCAATSDESSGAMPAQAAARAFSIWEDCVRGARARRRFGVQRGHVGPRPGPQRSRRSSTSDTMNPNAGQPPDWIERSNHVRACAVSPRRRYQLPRP
jgi:drug/metabolite transporter (DMT)-like permease